MSESILCDLCGKTIPQHTHYMVRIDVFADPEMPEMSAEELAAMDHDAEMEKILKEMESMTAEEAQDQVHRRFEYRICRGCQRKFLANPLGKPRSPRVANN